MGSAAIGVEVRMKNDKFEIKFWGVRGSIPVSGPEFERYGGNTSCIEVKYGNRHLIFDAGTGLRGLADRVEARGGLLRVESPSGGGTRIVGEIPCAS